MSHVIQATTGTIGNKATELQGLNAKFKKQIEDLISAESTLNGMWDGAANDTFHNAFQKDVTYMNAFYNNIEQYATKLNQIAREYEKAEQTNINTVNSK